MQKWEEILFKKAPVRSPLRDVLKKRCADRMKNNRDKVGIYFNVWNVRIAVLKKSKSYN